MSATRRRRPQVEVLESREVLDGTLGTDLFSLSATSGTMGLIDPTLNPVDPSRISLQVTITAVGTPVNGQVFSVTVQGLTASNLQPGSSYQFVIGGNSYTVSAVSPVEGGGYQLLFTTGIPSSQVTVGATGTLVIGGGAATTTSSTTTTSSSSLSLIDTTLNPTP